MTEFFMFFSVNKEKYRDSTLNQAMTASLQMFSLIIY